MLYVYLCVHVCMCVPGVQKVCLILSSFLSLQVVLSFICMPLEDWHHALMKTAESITTELHTLLPIAYYYADIALSGKCLL